MLFRKKMQRSCAYCVHGVKLEDGQILCTKKGIRSESNPRRWICLPIGMQTIPCKRKVLQQPLQHFFVTESWQENRLLTK